MQELIVIMKLVAGACSLFGFFFTMKKNWLESTGVFGIATLLFWIIMLLG